MTEPARSPAAGARGGGAVGSAPRLALFVTAFLDDVPYEELRLAPGESLDVGPRGRLRLPAPEGTSHVARIRWPDRQTVRVEDGRGVVHTLRADDTLRLFLGALRLEVSLTPQFVLRRSTPFAWYGSLAWLVIVMALSLVSAQVEFVYEKRCPWFGIGCPVPEQQASGVDADYLARLLREDYEGADQGASEASEGRRVPVVEPEPPPPDLAPKPIDDGFLPAGADGPPTEKGGADAVAPEPVRQASPPPPTPEPVVEEAPEVIEAVVEDGPPVAEVEPEEDPPEDRDAVADADEVTEDTAADDDGIGRALAEEIRGWGLQDWMDATPEQREIRIMLRYARERVRIDPEDTDALSLLAYYQYLSEDLDGAAATYEKLLVLEPDASAWYNNKALILKREGRYEEEERLYRTALSLDPDDTTAMNNLAVNLAHQRRFAEALDTMRELEELLPDDPYSDLHRAKIHAEMGNTAQAILYLEKALQGMKKLDTLHHIEFRQDIRLDPSFDRLRANPVFRATLVKYYGDDAPLPEDR